MTFSTRIFIIFPIETIMNVFPYIKYLGFRKGDSMEQNKVLSALCYISLLFAPFLLPLIVYFVVKDSEVKFHAKRAFLSHLIPVVFLILISLFGVIGMFSSYYYDMNSFAYIIFGLMAVYMIISIACIIWNIIQAIRVIR